MTTALPTFPKLYSDPGEEITLEMMLSRHARGRDWNGWPYSYYQIDPRARRVLEFMFDRFGPVVRQGRHKVAFIDSDGDIIKVPKTLRGVSVCELEVEMFEDVKHPHGVPMASCMIEPFMGWTIERMERLEDIPPGMALPSWADEVDTHQIGINSEGKLVAYDY